MEHSKQLADEFVAAGFKAEHLDGKTRRQLREEVIDRVRQGLTQVLVNVEIVTEGFDVPEVEVIVLVRPTLSRSLHRQMIGRGLRSADGKKDCKSPRRYSHLYSHLY